MCRYVVDIMYSYNVTALTSGSMLTFIDRHDKITSFAVNNKVFIPPLTACQWVITWTGMLTEQMTDVVKCFFFLTGVVIAKAVGRELAIVLLAISANGSCRDHSCPPQIETHIERVQKDISDGIQNIILPLLSSLDCGSGLWHRVAYLDMSDPSQLCPSPWREYSTSGLQTCGRQHSVSCSSVNYSSNGLQYGKVCG